MYHVSEMGSSARPFASTATIDAAIALARASSLARGVAIVVCDRGAPRVLSRDGDAWYLAPCRCARGGGTPFASCRFCHGLGHRPETACG